VSGRLRRPLALAGLLILAGLWALAATQLLRTTVPSGLKLPQLTAESFFTPAYLHHSASYERFLRIDYLLSELALLVALTGYALRGERLMRESAAGRVGTGLMLGMLGLAVVWIAQLPFGIAGLWWERRHGVSHAGYVSAILGSFVGLGSEFLFICFTIAIVMGFAGWLGNRWWVAGVPALVAVAVLISFVQPFLIPQVHSPRSAALRADARQLSRAEGIGSVRVKVQDVHEFTTAPNAEAVGLGPTRRVILWDTLLGGRFPRGEVRVVLAHEIGHIGHNHLWKGLAWLGLFGLPTGFLLALATRGRGGLYEPRAVPLALLVFVVLQLLLSPAQNAVTRRMEAEADWSALEATRDPIDARSAFERLARTSHADPDPPGWWQAVSGDHPTILQRIEMVQAWRARQAGGQR
jgi:Zn-dependent protease with chaperone function